MFEQINLQSFVDIGFVALITFACLKTMLQGGASDDRRREHWRDELKALERTLRSLISEASTASSSLDRSLAQRKRDLEQLLRKIEAKEKQTAAENPRRRTRSLVEEDLPNDTWREPLQVKSSQRKQAIQAPEEPEEEAETGRFVLGEQLDALAASASDTLSLSQSKTPAADARRIQNERLAQALAGSVKRTLSEEIELIKNDPVEGQTFAKTSIIDPSTYRIARRLLAEGKEIHVVARKLDLPLSEVRNLDRLIRRETPAEDSIAAEPARFVQEQPALSNDNDITRETALL